MSSEHDYDPRWNPETDWLMTSPYAPAQLEAQTGETPGGAEIAHTSETAVRLAGFPRPLSNRNSDRTAEA
jgi:hypothetical protein